MPVWKFYFWSPPNTCNHPTIWTHVQVKEVAQYDNQPQQYNDCRQKGKTPIKILDRCVHRSNVNHVDSQAFPSRWLVRTQLKPLTGGQPQTHVEEQEDDWSDVSELSFCLSQRGESDEHCGAVTHPGGKQPLQPLWGIKHTLAQSHISACIQGFIIVAILLLSFMQCSETGGRFSIR